ncbi:DUF1772 domain-containing protein [Microbacterium kyungheense]|uniref:DUF1772 domain-containing protein n=1 Tax=Microbacterium kyungheense TaxID=1263636 RepID=A0A543FL11_9MICO|nr:DUF1772 domain-containing protein [Microbacterium kyungheense]TQM34550.1 hypothetical protein FB391_0838 [Microbacterium kyungheense]
MDLIIGATATLAILALAVIYGTDVVAAVVQRPVYAEVDDRSLVQFTGRGHYYGDRRLPIVGIAGTVLTAATAGLSLLWGTTVTGIASVVALLLLLVWLTLFARISAPINKVLTAAALADEVPSNARALQARWESIIPLRAVLLGVTILLLCTTILLG